MTQIEALGQDQKQATAAYVDAHTSDQFVWGNGGGQAGTSGLVPWYTRHRPWAMQLHGQAVRVYPETKSTIKHIMECRCEYRLR